MIKGLDGIRGLAVLFVVFSHVEFWQRIGFDNEFTLLMFRGDFGVRLFFVLSGFLITHLLFVERESTGGISVKKFWVRRFLRLMPVYYLVIFLTLIVDLIGKINVQPCSYAYALLYSYNFVSSSCTGWQGFSHFWSLAVEEHFYLFWPIILYAGFRFGFYILAILIALVLYLHDLSFIFGAVKGINRWTFPAVLPIAIGCLGAYAIRNLIFNKLFSMPESSSLSLILSLTFVVAPYLVGLTPLAYALQSFGILFMLIYIYFNQESALVKILEFKPLVTLGVISYGLYIWQGFFTGNGPYRQFKAWPPGIDAGIFLTFCVAPISYYFYEKPFLKLKAYFR